MALRRQSILWWVFGCLVVLLAACSSVAEAPPAQHATDTPTAPAPIVLTPLPTLTHMPTLPPTPTMTPSPTATRPPTPLAASERAFARGSAHRRPIVVMIDNHPDSYPQSGLDNATMVVEALAEFGVTRYMAVFVPGISPDTVVIGPVRSTRTYFVQWAMGFNAVYVHAGGSPEGLQLAETAAELANMDALRSEAETYFYRSTTRVAPYNLYISLESILRFGDDTSAGRFDPSEQGYLFQPDKPAEQRPESQRIDYFFLYAEDPVGWTYDPQTNGYVRTRRGQPHRDAQSGKQLWFKNIIVMEVAEAPIPGDDKGRIEQQVIGEGRARLFADGIEREVYWRKPSAAAPLRFYDAQSQEITLTDGTIWVAVLPSLNHLSVH